MVTAAPTPAARRLGRVSPRGPAVPRVSPHGQGAANSLAFHWLFTFCRRRRRRRRFSRRRRQRADRGPAGLPQQRRGALPPGQLLPVPRGHARAHASPRPAPLRAQEVPPRSGQEQRVARQADPQLWRVTAAPAAASIQLLLSSCICIHRVVIAFHIVHSPVASTPVASTQLPPPSCPSCQIPIQCTIPTSCKPETVWPAHSSLSRQCSPTGCTCPPSAACRGAAHA